jgi:hypothetical protein
LLPVTGFAGANPAAPPLPINDIVSRLLLRNAERTASLGRFTGIRMYDVSYDGIVHKQAAMKVTATYDHGHKTFSIVSESGSKLLLDHVLHKLLTSEQEADATRNQTALNRKMAGRVTSSRLRPGAKTNTSTTGRSGSTPRTSLSPV